MFIVRSLRQSRKRRLSPKTQNGWFCRKPNSINFRCFQLLFMRAIDMPLWLSIQFLSAHRIRAAVVTRTFAFILCRVLISILFSSLCMSAWLPYPYTHKHRIYSHRDGVSLGPIYMRFFSSSQTFRVSVICTYCQFYFSFFFFLCMCVYIRNDEIRLVIKVTTESKTDQSFDWFQRTQQAMKKHKYEKTKKEKKNTKWINKKKKTPHKYKWARVSKLLGLPLASQRHNLFIYDNKWPKSARVFFFSFSLLLWFSYLLSIDSSLQLIWNSMKKSKPVVQQVFVYRLLVVVFLV